MSNAHIRHRHIHNNDAHSVFVTGDADRTSNSSKGGAVIRHLKLHRSVWTRIIGIVGLFTLIVVSVSRLSHKDGRINKIGRTVTTDTDFGNNSSGDSRVRASKDMKEEKLDGRNGSDNPLFVTVVMPRFVTLLSSIFFV